MDRGQVQGNAKGKATHITEVIASRAKMKGGADALVTVLRASLGLARATILSTQPVRAKAQRARPTVGLAYWMGRVPEDCQRASISMAADPVHDLRVALRRCRSMADGLMAIDPDPGWKAMKKAGKVLFGSLGELRDVQVMMEWVQRLGPPGDFETQALLDLLARREQSHKITASESLRAFDLRQWRKWSRELPHRANRLKPGSVVFKHLALERWSEAYELHRRAMRNRSQTALHQLRIGIKRFRYIVENFLLYHHEAWSSDLKELQDLLGDIHDLDVLWTTAVRVNAFGSGESRERWHATIVQARQKRLDRYRERMVGPESLWKVWRADLPQAHQIRTAASMRLELWASLLDPNFSHSQQVAALAARIYDGLAKVELVPASSNQDLRSILRTASLMHDVGRFRREKGHHKTSDRLIRRLKPPLGYSASELHLAAAIARFHRGALPQSQHKALREFPADQKKLVLQLAGILRFADVLDREQEGRVQNIQVEKKDGTVAISVQGYTPWRRAAQEIVGATHLLQLALGHAVRLKPLRPPRPQPTNSRPTRQTPSARPRRTESTIRT